MNIGLWERLSRNTGMKLVALLFAVLTWSYVMTSDDPERSRRVTEVPIQVMGMEELSQVGLTLRGTEEEIFAPVSVNVNVRISETKLLNNNSVRVRADLTGIQRKGIYEIVLSGTTGVGTVVSVHPSKLTVEVDELVTRSVPVTYTLAGKLADGLYIYPPALSVEEVEITGARKDVEQVTKAVCLIDLGKVTESVNAAYSLVMQDVAGNIVSYDQFENDIPSVTVKMEVAQKTELLPDLSPQACIANLERLQEKYRVVSISCQPISLDVLGDRALLGGTQTVQIEPVSLRFQAGTQTMEAIPLLPKGLSLPEGEELRITVVLVEK